MIALAVVLGEGLAARPTTFNHVIGVHMVVVEIITLAMQHKLRRTKSSRYQCFVGNPNRWIGIIKILRL